MSDEFWNTWKIALLIPQIKGLGLTFGTAAIPSFLPFLLTHTTKTGTILGTNVPSAQMGKT